MQLIPQYFINCSPLSIIQVFRKSDTLDEVKQMLLSIHHIRRFVLPNVLMGHSMKWVIKLNYVI